MQHESTDRSAFRSGLAATFDWASVSLVVLAVVMGALCGGGVSSTSRIVIQVLAALAAGSMALAMLCAGRWRILSSPVFWLLPAGFIGLALLQLAPLGGDWLGAPAVGWRIQEKGYSVLTCNRHATIQWLGFAIACYLIAIVAAHQMRRPGRAWGALIAIGLVIALSGLIGGIQSLGGNGKLAGLLHMQNPAFPIPLRDLFAADTAIGPLAFQPYREVAASDPSFALSSVWYEMAIAPPFLFGGFLGPAYWAAWAVLLYPLILVCGLAYARRVTAMGQTDWLSQRDGQLAISFILLAMTLAIGAAWFGNPIVVSIALVVSTLIAMMFVGPVERWRLGRFGALAIVFASAAALASGWRDAQSHPIEEHWKSAFSEDQSLVAAFRDHLLFGCGFGSAGDVLPNYQSESPRERATGASLLALAVEGGAAGVALVGVGCLWVLTRWPGACRRMTGEARLLASGVIGGMTGLALLGAGGVGLEAPAVFTAVAFCFGCLARCLAGGYLPAAGGSLA